MIYFENFFHLSEVGKQLTRKLILKVRSVCKKKNQTTR